jgi:hypothetical protein
MLLLHDNPPLIVRLHNHNGEWGVSKAFGGFQDFLLLRPFINSKILHLTHSLKTFTLTHSKTVHLTLAILSIFHSQ